MSSSSFNDLYPDILFDIFQYFSLNELFDIFIDLIPCLLNLINQSHINVHIDKNAKEDFWNEILPKINSNQIISLKNSFHLITNLKQFSFIHSINLNFQSLSSSSSLFDQFQYLIYLEQLTIELSKIIIEQHSWLYHILTLPKLKKLKLNLNISKNVFIPQKSILIDQLHYQSNTIKYLQMKIPMSWKSLILFLTYFPNLQIFRASLYQTNSLTLILNSIYFYSLQILDLQGYFNNMSSMIIFISSSMPNLKKCRLISMNVTNDDAFRMKHAFIWIDLFKYCSYLIQVKIHLIMSIEINNNFNIRSMKDLIQTFNNNSFCEKYHFQMEQLSINRGYVTLTGNYDMKKKI